MKPEVMMWIKNPKIKIEEVSYEIDYSDKRKKLFDKFYKDKNIIILNDEFKKNYIKFFEVKLISSDILYVSFEFTKFCETYNLAMKDYYEMVKNYENLLPFPLKINFKVKNESEVINCICYSAVLFDHFMMLAVPKGDSYVIIYRDQFNCEFKFIKDLDDNDKKIIEKCQNDEISEIEFKYD